MGKVDPEIARQKAHNEFVDSVSAPVDSAQTELRKLAIRGNAAGATAAFAYFAAITTTGRGILEPPLVLIFAGTYLVGLALGSGAHFVDVFRANIRMLRKIKEESRIDTKREAYRENFLFRLTRHLNQISFIFLILNTVAIMAFLYGAAPFIHHVSNNPPSSASGSVNQTSQSQ